METVIPHPAQGVEDLTERDEWKERSPNQK